MKKPTLSVYVANVKVMYYDYKYYEIWGQINHLIFNSA
jgi:hypothetical protein